MKITLMEVVIIITIMWILLWWIYQVKNPPKRDKVNDCIREYTRWIYLKYNNPDTVSNLREDNYSQVVRTCNEIFGNK